MRGKISHRGFTLVEILVVVAIIAVLATAVLFNVQAGKRKAHDTQRLSDLGQLELALRVYRDAYSTNVPPAYPSGDRIGDGVGFDADMAEFLTGQIQDPIDSGAYAYYYDSDYDCAGISRVVLVALTAEVDANKNWTTACNGTEDIVTGVTPGPDSYVVIIQ